MSELSDVHVESDVHVDSDTLWADIRGISIAFRFERAERPGKLPMLSSCIIRIVAAATIDFNLIRA